MRTTIHVTRATALALAAAGALACWTANSSTPPEASVAHSLRDRIEPDPKPQPGHRREGVALEQFYAARGYRPLWIGAKGPLPGARALLEELRRSEEHGLHSSAYEPEELGLLLASSRERKPSADSLADLDLRLTRSFLLYANDLANGRVRPGSIEQGWHAEVRQVDLGAALSRAADSGRIKQEIEGLAPGHEEYVRLQEALSRYLEIRQAGGWSKLAPGKSIKAGAQGQRVRALRARLARTGDLDPGQTESDRYDAALETAVRGFQARHGLEPDGVVGRATIDELNVPVEERIRQLEVNMERWRWIPEKHNLGDRFIIANIPGFELSLVEQGKPVMRMKIITGKSYDATPIMSDEITYLVLNPTWTVPESIAKEEILPKVQADPGYLASQSIRVLEHGGANAKEIDPSRVPWSSLQPAELKYVFRQEPGPSNPLGRIKFMFPNKFNVYLHDTPGDHLFDVSNRGLSHGCVRLEKPLELAALLLRDNSEWTSEKLLAAIQDGKTEDVKLSRPCPVHLLYWTAWVADDGAVQFRKDIYHLDARMGEALRRLPRGATIARAARFAGAA